jgi:hypothetical protein
VYKNSPFPFLKLRLPLPWKHNIGTSGNTQLVNGVASFPDAAATLDDGNHLLRNALSEAVLSASHVAPLRRSAHNPLDGLPTALPLTKRDRNLQRNTTTSGTPLATNSQKGGNRVNCQCEVENGVERKVGWRGCARKERALRVNCWDGRGAEVLKDQCHVLQYRVSRSSRTRKKGRTR